jgi:hypothetical protein
MRVLKPAWVTHGGSQIYAADVQPGSARLATDGGEELNDNTSLPESNTCGNTGDLE